MDINLSPYLALTTFLSDLEFDSRYVTALILPSACSDANHNIRRAQTGFVPYHTALYFDLRNNIFHTYAYACFYIEPRL